MSSTRQSGDAGRGSNGFFYFALGAIVVAIGVLGYMSFTHARQPQSSVERSSDTVRDAARDIGDAAKDATHNLPTPAPQPVKPIAPTTLPPS